MNHEIARTTNSYITKCRDLCTIFSDFIQSIPHINQPIESILSHISFTRRIKLLFWNYYKKLNNIQWIYSMVHIVYPWPKTRQLPFAIAQTRAKIFLAPFSWLENWDQNRKWAVNTRSEYQEKSHLGDTTFILTPTLNFKGVPINLIFQSRKSFFSLMNSTFLISFQNVQSKK